MHSEWRAEQTRAGSACVKGHRLRQQPAWLGGLSYMQGLSEGALLFNTTGTNLLTIRGSGHVDGQAG